MEGEADQLHDWGGDEGDAGGSPDDGVREIWVHRSLLV
jgi:hypothetical protein